MKQNLNQLFKLYLRDLKRRGCKTTNKINQLYDNNIKPTLGDKPITERQNEIFIKGMKQRGSVLVFPSFLF